MKQDEIIDMTRQAGAAVGKPTPDGPNIVFTQCLDIYAFAKLVAAKERKACAEKTGEFARKWWSIHCASNKHMETTRKAHDDFCALQAAIRARGES